MTQSYIKKGKIRINNNLRVYENIEDLISNRENPTPLVKLNERMNPNVDFPIYVKLERYNPFGSIKDRIAYSMIKDITFKEGQCLLEPSSGNTGIALASLANARGIPIEIAVPTRIPKENFRSSVVFLDPNQYIKPAIMENATKMKVYTIQ